MAASLPSSRTDAAAPRALVVAGVAAAVAAYGVLLHVLVTTRVAPRLALALIAAPWIAAAWSRPRLRLAGTVLAAAG